jgi:predicted transcriptional regulator
MPVKTTGPGTIERRRNDTRTIADLLQQVNERRHALTVVLTNANANGEAWKEYP